MSTLPPKPTYDRNVPVISSAGGGTAAYKDPNSPESILRKTSTLEAQGKVDSSYDVVETFKSRNKRKSKDTKQLIFVIFLILIIYFAFKAIKFTAKVFLGVIAIVLLIVIVVIYKNV